MRRMGVIAMLAGLILGCAAPAAKVEKAKDQPESPQIRTDKSTYVHGEKIQVIFSGSSGHKKDWISLSRASSPDREAGEYDYIPQGLSQGTMTFESPSPGKYEARGYFNYSRHGYQVSARCSFEVVDGTIEGGQKVQEQEPAPQGKSDQPNLTKLERAYTRIVCYEFKSVPEIAQSYPEEIKTMQQSMLESLKARSVFETAALSSPDQQNGSDTLLVTADVTGMNIIGFWSRGFIHNIGRRSWIELNLKLIDQTTQKVLREQKISSENSSVAAYFSFGINDRSLPSDLGKLLAEYIALVVPQK